MRQSLTWNRRTVPRTATASAGWFALGATKRILRRKALPPFRQASLDSMVRPRSVSSEHGVALMDAVATAAADKQRAETALHDAVRHAREAGVPWAVIGSAIGVSRQAAQERFSHPAPGRLV